MNDLGVEVLRNLNKALLTVTPNFLFDIAAEGYIAGHSIEELVQNVNLYKSKGRLSTVDILGESARTEEQANYFKNQYKTLIDLFSGGEKASVSVKGSAVCSVTEEGHFILAGNSFYKTLSEIVTYAEERNVRITMDMEDHWWTDLTLYIAKLLWRDGHENLGIVLQSTLDRTTDDIANLRILEPVEEILRRIRHSQFRESNFEDYMGISYDPEIKSRSELTLDPHKMRARICKGVYVEPTSISERKNSKVKKRMIRHALQLKAQEIYTEMASHDHNVIRGLYASGIDEWQLLRGVQKGYEIEAELRERGDFVRFYMPVEINRGDGRPYMKRRLIMNPGMLGLGIKNMAEKVYRMVS